MIVTNANIGEISLEMRIVVVDTQVIKQVCLIILKTRTKKNAQKLNIKAELHGIKNGWFFWPVNFDPVWLISCNGFTPKEALKDEETD